MASNGHLPASELAPIAGEGFLCPSAAAAWNAMAAKILTETGQRISPKGPDSSYRSYERQVYYWNLYQTGAGNLAASPGSSNHGLGLAIDTAYDAVINAHGAPFGWQKAWSDAASEPWHFKYATGHYSGPNPGPGYDSKGDRDPTPTLQRGDKGKKVERAQKRLQLWNKGVSFPEKVDGDCGEQTAESVREFQKIHELDPVDAIVGNQTWAELLQEDVLEIDERTTVNRLRLIRAGENKTRAEKDALKRLGDDIMRMKEGVEEAAKEKGWDSNERRKRFAILKGQL